MSTNYWRVGLALASILFATAVFYVSDIRISFAVSSCSHEAESDLVVECVFSQIRSEMERHGIASSMKIFSKAYERYPAFANGCHSRAHRVGDVAYFGLYLKGGFEALDFPQELTACGYGFFHGFMEHLVQDNPRPEFIDEVCRRLTAELGGRMGGIQSICYHGAGHGLVLARIERMSRAEWGSVDALVTWPAAECAKLTEARNEDVEQCYEGIFNVLLDTMVLKQYGFERDEAKPFAICMAQRKALQDACVYEMAQKLDALSDLDPKKMIELLAVLPDERQRITAFGVGMAGVVQQVIVTEKGYRDVLDSCLALTEPYYERCIKSVVGGLFEHGDPQKEYEKALALCEEDRMEGREVEGKCYQWVVEKLKRFYTAEKIRTLCPLFPLAYRDECEAQVST